MSKRKEQTAIMLYLEEKQALQLKDIAVKDHRSLTNLIEMILKKYLSEHTS